ncbi:MAG: hypothetical protein HYV46_16660 [candidate division NC10 bacterium]|nr:hypothetical protein [candidate division NC10 bacterium]
MTLDVHVRNGRTFLATKLFLPGRANGLGVVFSHGWGGAHLFDDLHAFLADTGGATLWDFPGGDHRLQTIDRPVLFERIRQALTAA